MDGFTNRDFNDELSDDEVWSRTSLSGSYTHRTERDWQMNLFVSSKYTKLDESRLKKYSCVTSVKTIRTLAHS